MISTGALWTAAALAGCTVETPDDSPFGTATTPVTSAATMNDSGDADSGDSDGGSSSGGGGTSGGSSDGGVATSTTGTTMTGDSSGDGGSGTQPTDGMYSSCAVAADCDALCITISDPGGGVKGGFCSGFPCANPAVDCDPSPGGTAVPACLPIDIDMMANTACYLSCAGGATCPAPMSCSAIEGGLEVCV